MLTELRSEAAAKDDTAPNTAPSAAAVRARLLHEVLIRTALSAPQPWWHDGQLAELILSDP